MKTLDMQKMLTQSKFIGNELEATRKIHDALKKLTRSLMVD